MTTTAIRAVGFCAHYSQQGDWAFDFALSFARRHSVQLNVFHFPSDPYDPHGKAGEWSSPEDRERLLIERERELRFYYDDRIGDYLDVGFRLCEHNEWTELHRCLTKREFQLLVLGHPSYGAKFAGKPLEEFADCFVCPVVLVGPTSPSEYYLNSPARLLADSIGIPGGRFHLVRAAG